MYPKHDSKHMIYKLKGYRRGDVEEKLRRTIYQIHLEHNTTVVDILPGRRAARARE